MVQDFDLDDFNMLDMKAKKDLTSLSEFENGILTKGELIHKNKGLLLKEINDAIRSLNQSLMVNLKDHLTNLPPYNFYAVKIRFRKTSTRKIWVNSCFKQVFRR